MECAKCSDDSIAIRLNDHINFQTGSVIINQIQPYIGQNIKRIDVYCNDLKYTSSAGIRALAYIKRELNVDAMVLHNLTSLVKDIFALTMMDRYFIFKD